MIAFRRARAASEPCPYIPAPKSGAHSADTEGSRAHAKAANRNGDDLPPKVQGPQGRSPRDEDLDARLYGCGEVDHREPPDGEMDGGRSRAEGQDRQGRDGTARGAGR